MVPVPQHGRRVVVILLTWLLAASFVGGAGLLVGLRPPAPQLIIVVLSAALVVASQTLPWLRTWSRTVDCRWLVLPHLGRFVGVYFLILMGQGRLPRAFALPAGWGDIVVAVLAVALLLLAPRAGRRAWGALFAWNLIGLVDILLVVAIAARLMIAGEPSMNEILHLPLSLLPTFLVPIVIGTHVLLLLRLHAQRGDAFAMRVTAG